MRKGNRNKLFALAVGIIIENILSFMCLLSIKIRIDCCNLLNNLLLIIVIVYYNNCDYYFY